MTDGCMRVSVMWFDKIGHQAKLRPKPSTYLEPVRSLSCAVERVSMICWLWVDKQSDTSVGCGSLRADASECFTCPTNKHTA
jgi:hypothetical protein